MYTSKKMLLRDEYSFNTLKVLQMFFTEQKALRYTNNFSILFCKYLISRALALIRFLLGKTADITKRTVWGHLQSSWLHV